MTRPAPARLAAIATALAILATGISFAGPASAETERPVADGIPFDPTSAYTADDLDSVAGGARTVPEIEGSVTTAATGVVEGLLTIEGVPAVTGSSFVAFLLQGTDGLFRYETTVETFSGTGAWSASGLPEGTYRVEFYSYQGDLPNNVFWADGEPGDASDFWFGSTSLVLGADDGFNFGTINIPVRNIDSLRIAGDDRFATSVAISNAAYNTVPAQGVPVVYIVNGLGFADALSAGPAAAQNDGVMLLVRSTSIPAVVQLELDRLSPQRIVIAGGTGVISAGVQTALGAYSNDVDRLGGSDRYETSRLIVDDAFGVVDELFVATGSGFPDALAAGPAASRLGGPVLLVRGSASTVDPATEAMIRNLGGAPCGDCPGDVNVNIAGGTGVVSAAFELDIASITSGSTVRSGGDDRYETASLINLDVFGEYGSDYALLASGANFPDALAGGPLAAIADAPLYLSRTSCIPASAFDDILFLFTKEVWVIGGAGVLSSQVMQGRVC